MSEENNLLTTQEAAQELGISGGYLRTMIINGQAQPARQIGGTWVFTRDEIERLRTRPKLKGGRGKKREIVSA